MARQEPRKEGTPKPSRASCRSLPKLAVGDAKIWRLNFGINFSVKFGVFAGTHKSRFVNQLKREEIRLELRAKILEVMENGERPETVLPDPTADLYWDDFQGAIQDRFVKMQFSTLSGSV